MFSDFSGKIVDFKKLWFERKMWFQKQCDLKKMWFERKNVVRKEGWFEKIGLKKQ